MNRTLGFYPLFMAAVTIVTILAVCFFNMYLLVKHKPSPSVIWIHLLSLLAVFSLIFYMIRTAVFVHPLSGLHGKLARITILFTGFGALGGVIFAFLFKRTHRFNNLNHSIPEALQSLADIVFVADQEGTITHINHPKKYRALFGKSDTMAQFTSFLYEFCTWDETGSDEGNYIDINTYRLHLEQANVYMNLQMAPFAIGGNQLGYTVVINDVSAIRESEVELEAQNEALRQANIKLADYIKASGALEAEKERLQILTQVQETLIRDMEKALFSIQIIKQQCFKDSAYQTAMKGLASQLRLIYQKVRCAVGQISGKDVNV